VLRYFLAWFEADLIDLKVCLIHEVGKTAFLFLKDFLLFEIDDVHKKPPFFSFESFWKLEGIPCQDERS
jgi:hypothetical protein